MIHHLPAKAIPVIIIGKVVIGRGPMRIASFNVQNLRLRHHGGDTRMQGARDSDNPLDIGPGATLLDPLDRNLTAAVLRDIDADVIALQEVFDRETLDYFHDHFLLAANMTPYPHRICLPGNDGRGLDVALLSRLAVHDVQSHARLTPRDLGLRDAAHPDRPIFRRDCLMVTVGRLTLFICHFKAPYPDPVATWPVRRLEAQAVRRLIERRFPSGHEGYWLILGDLNEHGDRATASESAIAPLTGAFSVNLLDRLPDADRWTYRDPTSRAYSSPDVALASPALARDWPDARPILLREGMSREAWADAKPRLSDVGYHRPHASDHAAVVINLDGIERAD